MANYMILTDIGSDLNQEILQTWNVPCINLRFRSKDEDKFYTRDDMPFDVFYQQMRAGTVFSTAAPNLDDFQKAFLPCLEEGLDILYLGFSSGLSNTSGIAEAAAVELREQYPERKIVVFDTLCASAGHGLLVYLAVKKRDAGATIEELSDYVTVTAPKVAHWFTVEDLVYLKRGGRVSPTAALLGSMLNIKPVLHMDDEGRLAPVSKVRGRKKAIQTIAETYSHTAIGDGTYFISHGDCLEDALELERLIVKEHGKKADMITEINPIIGAHSGPGTLALFFLASNR